MLGTKVVLIISVLSVIFHFTLHWTWRETIAAPAALLTFYLFLTIYELVTDKRRRRMTQSE
jgi:hypothetical protein